MAPAELAARSGDAPFGAVIVDALDGVVAAEHNRVRETLDPSAHAEINTIRLACGRVRRSTLEGYRLYDNKEPRPMCLVCAIEAKLSHACKPKLATRKKGPHCEDRAVLAGTLDDRPRTLGELRHS